MPFDLQTWKTDVKTRIQGWERNHRDVSDLYRGTRLAQALDWAKAHASDMSPLEREYIKACETEQKRERRAVRIYWASSAGAIAVGLIVIVLGMTGQLDRFILLSSYPPLEMEYVTVPAGEFMMGSEDGKEDESPVHTVYLDAYEIGKYEVTNEQYYQCVNAGVCFLPKNVRYNSPEYVDHPMADVSWFDAKAFCEWNDPDGRLPTEAEWEKAARGTDGRTYPWGEGLDCSLANYYGKDKGTDYCVDDATPVGSYESGVSPFGAYDMAGNVWEWVADWYDSDYYASSPEVNPTGPASGDYRVMRGGSWRDDYSSVRSANRKYYNPSSRVAGYDFGFRCARSP